MYNQKDINHIISDLESHFHDSLKEYLTDQARTAIELGLIPRHLVNFNEETYIKIIDVLIAYFENINDENILIDLKLTKATWILAQRISIQRTVINSFELPFKPN